MVYFWGLNIYASTLLFAYCPLRLSPALLRASRLGLDACLATKVGSDANGNLILRGMQEEGVDVSRVVVSDATPSAFTYVIVDREGFTRTCLHTPQTEGACVHVALVQCTKKRRVSFMEHPFRGRFAPVQ